MRARRSIALLCLVSLGACATLQYAAGPPPPDLATREIRIYTTGGVVVGAAVFLVVS